MSAAPLRLVSDDPAEGFPWPLTGELISIPDAHHRIQELKEGKDALHRLLEERERKYRRQEKLLEEEANPLSHPKGKEIVDLFERWKQGSGHPKALLGLNRMKLIKARLKDGYPIKGDNEASLELAIDGICAYPYAVYDKRFAEGRKQDRRDDFELALKDEKHVESLARLGWTARREGWTPDHGWRGQAAA